jgi:hypothetical protein
MLRPPDLERLRVAVPLTDPQIRVLLEAMRRRLEAGKDVTICRLIQQRLVESLGSGEVVGQYGGWAVVCHALIPSQGQMTRSQQACYTAIREALQGVRRAAEVATNG